MGNHKRIDGVWKRIDLVIADSGLSKSEVARRCGFSRQTLTEKSRGKMPSLGTLTKFCAAMGVSSDFMLGLPNDDSLNVVKDIIAAEKNLRKAHENAIKFYITHDLAENETQAKVMINYQLNRERTK